MEVHTQWHSRGYLPHLDSPGLVQSLTIRLHDAVPKHVVARWKQELGWSETLPASDPRVIQLHRRIERFEDAGYGACWLARDNVARLVEGALLHFDSQRYRVIAWCIMPNHVHVLIETIPGCPLSDVLHSWKSFTSKEANKLLGRKGTFWMEEYHDRFIRNEKHLTNVIRYIDWNPVLAGLVEGPEDWRYSSAARRRLSTEATRK